jgi:hypothetical protein
VSARALPVQPRLLSLAGGLHLCLFVRQRQHCVTMMADH